MFSNISLNRRFYLYLQPEAATSCLYIFCDSKDYVGHRFRFPVWFHVWKSERVWRMNLFWDSGNHLFFLVTFFCSQHKLWIHLVLATEFRFRCPHLFNLTWHNIHFLLSVMIDEGQPGRDEGSVFGRCYLGFWVSLTIHKNSLPTTAGQKKVICF